MNYEFDQEAAEATIADLQAEVDELKTEVDELQSVLNDIAWTAREAIRG